MSKFIIITFLLICVSCSTQQPKEASDFAIKQGYKLKPGSIAVVPATLDDADVLLAKYIANSLQKKKVYNVIAFQKVYDLLPKDSNMVSEYGTPSTSSIKDFVFWLSDKNKKRINAFQKKVKSQYIFLVWNEGIAQTDRSTFSGQYRGSDYGLVVTGRFIEYNNKQIVGYTLKIFNKETSIFNFSSDTSNIGDLIKESSEIIASQIINKTK